MPAAVDPMSNTQDASRVHMALLDINQREAGLPIEPPMQGPRPFGHDDFQGAARDGFHEMTAVRGRVGLQGRRALAALDDHRPG
jgi:hypothetical protein